MVKFVGIIMCIFAMSFFFFPVTLIGMPQSMNTKMIMGAIGIPVFFYNLSKTKDAKIEKGMIALFGLACCVSFVTYMSITINNTLDYTYVTYVISMLVWTSAAYISLKLIENVHGYVDAKLIILYLMIMCTLQCILAMTIEMNVNVAQFIDRYYPESAFFHEKKRMYGLGCGLDVAGGRFSAVLVMLAYLLYKNSKDNNWIFIVLCMACFIIISVIGNMIGRTTTVGMLLGLAIIGYSLFTIGVSQKYICSVVGILILLAITGIILYNTNAKWQENIEFGFEGFFSLIEKGKWEVHSNDMLREGFIYPDNLKTWLIGDGYFNEPSATTPYYTGESFYGFYMGTDAGYSRFIFYFGIIGLSIFSAYFISVARFCAKLLPKYKYMFWAMALLNFLIWIKVSTDIYVTFASFVCLSMMKAHKCKDYFKSVKN